MIDPEQFYLDWFNNYLTVGKIAEHYGLSEPVATQIITIGRNIHLNHV